MKKHNIFKVIGLTILATFLLTWILPTATFEQAYTELPRAAAGIFDLLSYPALTLSYFNYVIVTVLAIAVFYGVLKETKVADRVLDKVTKKCKKPIVLISVLTVFLSLYVSLTGSLLTALFFVPMIIGLVLRFGYSKKVSALVTVGAIATGVMGTTIGTNNSLMIDQILSLDMYLNILIKIALLLTTNALLLFFVNEKINEEGLVKEEVTYLAVKDKKEKVSLVPFALIMFITKLILILAYMPWEQMGVSLFETMTTELIAFELFGTNFFGLLLGNIPAFGSWTAIEGALVITIAAFVLGFAYNVKLRDIVDNAFVGMRKAVYPAGLMMFTYVVLIIATYHPFQVYLFNVIFNLTKGFNVLTTALVGFISAVLNVEMLYGAQASLPLFTSIVGKQAVYPVVQLIYNSMSGLSFLIAPTSVVLVGVLSHLGINYKEWIKYTWKLFVGLLVLSLLVSTGVLIFFV